MTDRTFTEIAEQLGFKGFCIALLNDDYGNWCVTDDGANGMEYPMQFGHRCPKEWFEDSIDKAMKNFLKRENLGLDEIFGDK